MYDRRSPYGVFVFLPPLLCTIALENSLAELFPYFWKQFLRQRLRAILTSEYHPNPRPKTYHLSTQQPPNALPVRQPLILAGMKRAD